MLVGRRSAERGVAMGLIRTQTTRSWGSMRLFSRMAARTAPPSFPVGLVRASILLTVINVVCQGRS